MAAPTKWQLINTAMQIASAISGYSDKKTQWVIAKAKQILEEEPKVSGSEESDTV